MSEIEKLGLRLILIEKNIEALDQKYPVMGPGVLAAFSGELVPLLAQKEVTEKGILELARQLGRDSIGA